MRSWRLSALKTISLRLPEEMINDLKILAKQRDVPCQFFMKILLAEKIQEMRSRIHQEAQK
ncbi:MAG: hypothetical protein CVV41_01370 [Candidatus Riflebacteria bacterium HGW-Riflebacteria-1]|nr:MAG: hypothetical protein CVV41_01370 [Candidatus Riflebacteria bacterium HGW-Riflebacteria-1]